MYEYIENEPKRIEKIGLLKKKILKEIEQELIVPTKFFMKQHKNIFGQKVVCGKQK